MGEPDLNQLFIPTFEGNTKEASDRLAKTVKKHGGQGHFLTLEEKDRLREKSEEAYNRIFRA